ncbi:MAG: IS110 family transposase, partial [Actinobacteria bacterium]|nr:IS110 family transposase [Actinomycetota bacterium]
RNLIDVPVTDVFGQGGRRWLADVVLPAHEREQVDSNLRLHDALDVEVKLVERQLAEHALARRDVRHLMTIPGVGAITALALVAVIGDATRFPSPRHLVGYLGLDPRVRQSGDKAARHGHISRAGQAHARGLLVEAAHTAIRTPGPLRAFHARIATRRGKQIALCATARKLAVLAWHLLSKDEDYRYGAPTINQRKLRALQRKAGDNGPKISLAGETKRRVLERRFLEEAERNYQHYVAQKAQTGAGAANEDTTVEAVKAPDDARQAPQSPDACSSRTGSPAPERILAPNP